MQRSPTFLVNSAQQKDNLADFQKREEHVETAFGKKIGVPLCFNADAYQKTHPAKQRLGYKDADATLTAPMLIGVCDGVSQLEDFGMDPSELPQELLRMCEELAMAQLIPNEPSNDVYRGPVSLLSDAYEATEVLGSTTVLVCALDNMSKIHGKVHPMVAVLSIGDCELLLLRRPAPGDKLEILFHTEMQRIGGHNQTPLQVARVDERIDADFDDDVALEVIREGSAVHCLSVYEGDIVVLGSDGVFDNLYLHEVVNVLNENMPPPGKGLFCPTPKTILKSICEKVVRLAHSKSGDDGRNRLIHTPIGMGGKVDDTSLVVAEVVEWTEAHRSAVRDMRRHRRIRKFLGCVAGRAGADCMYPSSKDNDTDEEEEYGEESDEEEEDEEEEGDERKCTIL